MLVYDHCACRIFRQVNIELCDKLWNEDSFVPLLKQRGIVLDDIF